MIHFCLFALRLLFCGLQLMCVMLIHTDERLQLIQDTKTITAFTENNILNNLVCNL